MHYAMELYESTEQVEIKSLIRYEYQNGQRITTLVSQSLKRF